MPIVTPKLDDLRFQSVVEQLTRSIPTHTPEWTDHNASDPGITLIELFAHLAEQIGYRLNRVPEKNYIEFLKLIGIRLRPAEPATTRMQFILARPEHAEAFVIPAGSRIKAKTEDAPVFETDVDVDAVPAQLAALVTTRSSDLRDLTLGDTPPADGDDSASYVPSRFSLVWDGRQPKLKDMPEQPVGLFLLGREQTHAHLWIGLAFNPSRTAGFLGQRVTLHVQLDDDEQPDATAVADCAAGIPELVDPDNPGAALAEYHYYRPPQPGQTTGSWHHLSPLSDTTEGWTKSGSIRFDVPTTLGPIPDAEWKPIRAPQAKTTEQLCREAAGRPLPLPVPIPHPLVGAIKAPVAGTPTAVPVSGWLHVTFPAVVPAFRLRAISFNTVPATNAERVRDELLGMGTGLSSQALALAHGNVLPESLKLAVGEPADSLLHTWRQVDSFDAAGPFDHVYVLDPESGTVTFGDGVRGRPPALGVKIVALQYRHGGGEAGEVSVGQVSALDGVPSPVTEAVNIVAARGGKDAETLEEAKLRAPKVIKAGGRAVTDEDFVFWVKQTRGHRIARAIVVPLRMPYPVGSPSAPGLDVETPAPGAVSVVVVPDAPGLYPTPTESMLHAACRQLDGVRLITTEVYVVAPQYVRLFNIDVRVAAEAGYGRTELREAIARHLERYFHVLSGGDDGTGFPFGTTIHHADVVAQVSRVEGVARVEHLTASYDGNAPVDDGEERMQWRQLRRRPRRLVGCIESEGDDARIDLLPDETVFVDSSSLLVSVV